MKFVETIPWVAGASISAGLSWWALHPQPNDSPAPLAHALPRPATEDERELLSEQASQLSTWIQAASAESGSPIPLHAVESSLPQPIFDNPLVDGVGGFQESCPVEALENPGLDWVYCPDTGRFLANIPG